VKRTLVSSKSTEQARKSQEGQAKLFVFCEKSSGTAQFRAESDTNPENTVERMAGLLAMQCLVRGHDPDDFVVLVPAETGLSGRLVSRAKQLLNEGRAVASPASLSPRQSEILHSVIRNQANKEIASKLNITVRTVKFHISSLLSKFGVENRGELARRAQGLMRTAAIETDNPAEHSHDVRRRDLSRSPIESSLSSTKNENFRFTRNVLTA
jgi:DNA-binding CsgD family transcriptional regulator